MKAKKCKYPFDNFVGYRQLLPNGRTYVYMWDRDTNQRRLISRARYRMSVHLGRILDPDEEVDHVDEDFTNDDLSNLQILTGEQNTRKSHLRRRGLILKDSDQFCEVCGGSFRSDRLKVVCSVTCRSLLLKDGRASRSAVSDSVVKEIKKLRASGGTSYSISKDLGISRNTVMKYWK